MTSIKSFALISIEVSMLAIVGLILAFLLTQAFPSAAYYAQLTGLKVPYMSTFFIMCQASSYTYHFSLLSAVIFAYSVFFCLYFFRLYDCHVCIGIKHVCIGIGYPPFTHFVFFSSETVSKACWEICLTNGLACPLLHQQSRYMDLWKTISVKVSDRCDLVKHLKSKNVRSGFKRKSTTFWQYLTKISIFFQP